MAAHLPSARRFSSDRGGFSEKTLDSDDHFDRPFLFMAMKGSHQTKKKTQKNHNFTVKTFG